MSFPKKYLLFFVTFICIFTVGSLVHAQSSDAEKQLNTQIEEYQQKLTELGQQRNTLSSQIQQMDTQWSLAELQIQRSEQKIYSNTK